MEKSTNNHGGARAGAGRKKLEGSRHMYKVAEDVHEWIMVHGGGSYITDTIRAIMEKE